VYSGMLDKLLGDTFTPLGWEGFKASATDSRTVPISPGR
jgi:hypothetical protein